MLELVHRLTLMLDALYFFPPVLEALPPRGAQHILQVYYVADKKIFQKEIM